MHQYYFSIEWMEVSDFQYSLISILDILIYFFCFSTDALIFKQRSSACLSRALGVCHKFHDRTDKIKKISRKSMTAVLNPGVSADTWYWYGYRCIPNKINSAQKGLKNTRNVITGLMQRERRITLLVSDCPQSSPQFARFIHQKNSTWFSLSLIRDMFLCLPEYVQTYIPDDRCYTSLIASHAKVICTKLHPCCWTHLRKF